MDEAERQRQLKLKFEFEKAKAAAAGVKKLDRPSDVNVDLSQKQPETYGTPGQAELSGATPEIFDYAPMAEGLVSMRPFESDFSTMSPEDKKDFFVNLGPLTDEEKDEALRSIIKQNWMKEVEKNKSERSKLKSSHPGSYQAGKLETGIPMALAAGALAGPSVAAQGLAGMATAGIQDASPESMLAGGLIGAGSAAIGNAAMRPIRLSNEAMSAPGAGDELIAKGLGYDDQAITAMKANDEYFGRVARTAKDLGVDEASAQKMMAEAGFDIPFRDSPSMSDVASVVRANASAPYSAQALKDKIQLPAIARGAQGTQASPMVSPEDVALEVAGPGPGNFRQQSLEGAYEAALMGPKEIPATMMGPSPTVPPLAPAARSVAQKAGEMATASRGMIPGQGFQPTTLPGALRGALLSRGELATGILAPAKAKKMLDLINSRGGQAAGAASMSSYSSVVRLVSDVQSSEDPVVLDYMYQEMYPEYRQLSLEAENEIAKENK